jgi:preprotein translocase subunit SecA
VAALMDRFKIPADTPIEHPLISRQIESAQKKVEQYYFGIRKQVLQFDDVMDRQRKSIYGLRQKILTGQLSAERLKEMAVHLVKKFTGPHHRRARFACCRVVGRS